MKYLVSTICILTVCYCFGQAFSPFNAGSPKRFVNATNPSDNDYFFYSIQTDFSGDSIIFNQYLKESSDLVDVTGTYCEGWGGGMQPTADTTWLGRRIIYNITSKELISRNRALETLRFDFGMSQGDSAIFFTDNSGNDYFIRFDNLVQEAILGESDYVKSFSVWKYDAMENIMSSPLNGFEIKLSENLGMVSFIECDQFPNVEKGLTLMGQINPNLGNYQMTYDEVFPWEPGDTLEVRGSVSYYNGGVSVTSTKLITIVDRVETSDSVWIYLNIDNQVVITPESAPSNLSSFNISYPNPLVYAKKENISQYPDGGVFGRTTYFSDTANQCGELRRFTSIGRFSEYCDSCDCFIPIDGFGSSSETHKYVKDLGKTYIKKQPYGPEPNQSQASLIYSNVGGVRCGSYAPLSIDEYHLNQKRELIKIVDLMGRETFEKSNTVLIYVYSDGTTEKKFLMD